MTRDELRFWGVGMLGSGFLRILGRTLRFEVHGAEAYQRFRREGRPVIFAFWHSRILPLAYVHRNQQIVVLVSQHGDGEYITRVIQRMGFATARGSSTRGGMRGLRELIRQCRAGRDVAITPDGPKGPAREFKSGALMVARLTGAPIIPVATGSSGAWRVGSWDRFMIPKPFARFQVRYGSPYFIPRECEEEELEGHARKLEAVLNGITDQVDGRTGFPGVATRPSGVGPEASP